MASEPDKPRQPSSSAVPKRPDLLSVTPSPAGSDSSLAGMHGATLSNAPGYTTPVFKGKDAQRKRVEQLVAQGGFVPLQLVSSEVNWFYDHLGIDDTYFTAETAEGVADHVLALYGAKVLAYTKHDPSKLFIELEKINPDGSGAVFIHNSQPGVTATSGPGATCEKRFVYYAPVHLSLSFLLCSRRCDSYELMVYERIYVQNRRGLP